MDTELDTRPWNLLASLALVTGCGSRLIGAEAGDDGTNTSNTTATTNTTSGPECVSDADCDSYEYCDQGVCRYGGYHDGHLDHYDDGWYYECYVDEDCGDLALCEFNYCYPVATVPQCETISEQPVTLAIPATPLALSFVDVDADGADELVVATELDLNVFESDSPDAPVFSPRLTPTPFIDAMVGGAFDVIVGDDVLILAQDQLLGYGSDGAGNLIALAPVPSPAANSYDLDAAEIDGMEPNELLLVAQQSAGVIEGPTLTSSTDVYAAIARGVETMAPGFTVVQPNLVQFFDALGAEIGGGGVRGDGPMTLAGLRSVNGPRDVSTSRVGSWTLVTVWDPVFINEMGVWGLFGWASESTAIDLTGDGSDDLALLIDGRVWLHRDPLSGGCISELGIGEIVTGLAAGDFDGDGDDELAVRTGSNAVQVFELD